MSTSEPTDALRTVATTTPALALRDGVETLTAGAAELVRVVAFWFAALLPLTYLPMVATNLVGEYAVTFTGLLALHAVTLLVGHGYGSAD
ncbi:hypothetical protein [Halorarum halobium]|uniref:hypothetical protein n=1 Tax=Halorarum halobium TaxID=3075121 RepID=UPI0028AC7EA9|nr:hypothetical protein [Halobaculum sp. XH14]